MLTTFSHSVLFAYIFYEVMTEAMRLPDYPWESQRELIHMHELIRWHGIVGIIVILLVLTAQLIVMVAALRVHRFLFIFFQNM